MTMRIHQIQPKDAQVVIYFSFLLIVFTNR